MKGVEIYSLSCFHACHLIFFKHFRLCLGSWVEHGERTGGFYACNRYESAKKEGVVRFFDYASVLYFYGPVWFAVLFAALL